MSFRVLLVDDSRLTRAAVADLLSPIPNVEVCGEAANGRDGLVLIEKLKPDLIIMDIEMPVMDGIDTLLAMKERQIKIPVLVLSSATSHGARSTFRALECGALDFVPKPSAESGLTLHDIGELLAVRVRSLIPQTEAPAAAAPPPSGKPQGSTGSPRVLILASSTGGPQALYHIFQGLNAQFPVPILIIQHMPPFFTAAFAERLSGIGGVRVREAEEGMEVGPGEAVVAPGGRHLRVSARPNGKLVCQIGDDPPVNAHRPSIDVTLENVVDTFGGQAACVIFTGMGKDGVHGMRLLHDAGGLTIAQDEATSVVFGMNRRAIEAGAVDRVLPLENMVDVISEIFKITR